MVSPEKCIIFSQNFGKNYTFCDRFIAESILEITQTVDPGFEQELDPKTKLEMIKLEVKCQARCNVIKSIGFLKGTVVSQTEKGMRKSYGEYFRDLQSLMKDTCEQRLQHHLNPVLSTEVKQPKIKLNKKQPLDL